MPARKPAPSFVLASDHLFYYSSEAEVSATALADSLIGLQGVVERAAEIFGRLLDDAKIKDVQVLITSVEAGSYKENFFVRIIFGKGRKLEANLEKLRKTLKLDEKMDSKKWLALSFLAVLAYGAWLFAPKDSPASITITNSFNNIGREVNMTGDQVQALVAAVLEGKNEATKRAVVKLVNPEGQRHSGEITIDGHDNLTIPQQALQHIPLKYEKPEADKPDKKLKGVMLTVRAIDLDYPSKGWAAIIPDVSDRRLVLELAPTLKPEQIPLNKYIYADVTITYKKTARGEDLPAKYILHSFSDKPPEE